MLNLRTFSISRLTRVVAEDDEEENCKLSFQSQNELISGYIETGSPEYAAMVEGEFGKTYRFFSDDFDSTLTIGDRLTDQDDSTIYDVKGVIKASDTPSRKLEATIILAIKQ